jgi:hypothetical protein
MHELSDAFAQQRISVIRASNQDSILGCNPEHWSVTHDSQRNPFDQYPEFQTRFLRDGEIQ